MGNNKTKEDSVSWEEIEQVGKEAGLPVFNLLCERIRQAVFIWARYVPYVSDVTEDVIDDCAELIMVNLQLGVTKGIKDCKVVLKHDGSAGEVSDVNGDSESQSNG